MKKISRRTFKLIRNIIIVLIILGIILAVLTLAPNYKNDEITDQTNLVINNNNITAHLKNKVIVKDGVVYLSRADVDNFFDPYIYYNKTENHIVTTYGTKVASLYIDNPNITINDIEYTLKSPVIKEDNTVYLPFSLMGEVYNADIKYAESTDTAIVETLSREKITAQAVKDIPVRSKMKILSRTVDTVKKGNDVVIISNMEDDWIKVRTENGKIGYVKTSDLTNTSTVRETEPEKKLVDGKVNMIWDNFYVSAPDRTGSIIAGLNVVCPTFFDLVKLGQGELDEKMGNDGLKYINWAKSNNYQIWARVFNDSMIQTTSEIMNSYENRSRLINNILNYVQKYNLEGINIDFEYMYDKDIDMFTQFLVELHPRMKEINAVLSVDVTAPDGSENWSTCYNRHDIADNCDYIIFMAYDQYGGSSPKAGSTAAYDWILSGVKKFIDREEIDSEKIILGLPFYMRKWEENYDGTLTNNNGNQSIIDMKNVSNVIPSGVERIWLENERQYYVEYNSSGNRTYKIWIEDETSMREKLSIIKEYNLAGAYFWAKDREPVTIWPVIAECLN